MTTYVVQPLVIVTPLWSGAGHTNSTRQALPIQQYIVIDTTWSTIGHVTRPGIVYNAYGGGGGSGPSGWVNFS